MFRDVHLPTVSLKPTEFFCRFVAIISLCTKWKWQFLKRGCHYRFIDTSGRCHICSTTLEAHSHCLSECVFNWLLRQWCVVCAGGCGVCGGAGPLALSKTWGETWSPQGIVKLKCDTENVVFQKRVSSKAVKHTLCNSPTRRLFFISISLFISSNLAWFARVITINKKSYQRCVFSKSLFPPPPSPES